jgi:hypothetical protein
MLRISILIPLLTVLLLTGCGLRVALRGELDPAYAPKKTDPLALVLPDNSSIEDRQAFAAMKNELIKSGFNLVSTDHAMWILGVGTHEETYFSGVKNSGFVLGTSVAPGVAIGSSFGSSNAEYASQLTIYCWLFPAESYRAGKRIAIWTGIEKTTPDKFYDNSEKLVSALVGIYGVNFYDDSERVSAVKNDVENLHNP